jgi:Ca2+-binding RTX toxin-like protein
VSFTTSSSSSSDVFTAQNAASRDTIALGAGSDTIYESGQASVNGTFSGGTFGSATLNDGALSVTHVSGVTVDTALIGSVTIDGSAAATKFIAAGAGADVFGGGTGASTFIGGGAATTITGGTGSTVFQGGAGHTTITGGSGSNLFQFLTTAQGGVEGGSTIITNFVAKDQLYLEGNSLAQLNAAHDITTKNGNTYISLDGGHTTIELKGYTGSLTNSITTTHK